MAKKEDDFHETERVPAFTLMSAEFNATIKKRSPHLGRTRKRDAKVVL